MTILTWALRLVIFGLLLLFALQNTDPVRLRFLPAQAWEAPLVIVLLVFFVLGIAVGMLSLLATIYRQRREISRLKQVSPPAAITIEPPAV